ncbi:putative PAS/PAC sensor protein [Alkalidesulfovibrio alkalitolerans DSM 16529]|uniref:histidine kinase n=1 Tax=Alkalidesulfovibrio alkalitolerans DSM 16529 TaxID=1121439 RepID=S7T8L0_9BACT|nr:response regulator [Alkalidesulfovibrio alkalitolerans]EPR32931.1 putative PAS/PAC sensor protein [Alkalidesulfovibrio alkalitolerans DSM 16529]
MPRTVLLADDEDGIRRMLGLILSDLGHEVIEARDGREALSLFEARRPDIVVTDVRMPGVDGLDLLRRIKAERPGTEVIIITGHADLDLAIEGLRLDAGDFIAKPVRAEVLEIAIRRAEAKIGLREQLARQSEELQRRLHDELAASQLRFQLLFDEAPCFIAVLDRNLVITAANRRLKEEIGGHVGELCHKALKRSASRCPECPVQATFRDGQSHRAEAVIVSREGKPLHVLIRTAPILGPDGEVEQVMELAADITEVRQLENHLTQLGMLMASLSHGIKGLLTALDGAVYKVDSGIKRDDRERLVDGWAEVRTLLGRVKGMVLDILYCAKKREPNLARVDVAEFAARVADVIESKAETHGVGFVRDFGPSLGTFMLDEGALSAALVNLLENAVEACLADASRREHEVTFAVRRNSGALALSIADNGVGMPAETKNKLFTVFFSTKGSRGTGLGLFIARQTVQAHGGTIGVESTPGEGSVFTITLPGAARDSCEAEMKEPAAKPPA